MKRLRFFAELVIELLLSPKSASMSNISISKGMTSSKRKLLKLAVDTDIKFWKSQVCY